MKRAEYELGVHKYCVSEVFKLIILQTIVVLVSAIFKCRRGLGVNRRIRYSLLQHLNLSD